MFIAANMQTGLGQVKRKAPCAARSERTLAILWRGPGFKNNSFSLFVLLTPD